MDMCEDWLYMYLCAVCDKQILVLILQYSCILINIMYKLLSKASNTMVNIGVFNIFFSCGCFNQQHYKNRNYFKITVLHSNMNQVKYQSHI